MIYCEDCSSYDCGCPERNEIESLRQQLVDYQTKHDVACSTINMLQEKCDVRGNALSLQCQETKEVRQQLAESQKQVTLLRDALIYAETQLADIIDTRLIDEALAATEPTSIPTDT